MIRYWPPEPMFVGKDVAILGNGPSMSLDVLGGIDPQYAIAVNAAIELMPVAAVLFSRDAKWCADNWKLISSASSPLKITTNRAAAHEHGMLAVAMERRDDFPPLGSLAIRYGISSGHAAVSLAVAMGASRVALYGFDGQVVNGRSHWHEHYAEHRHEIYAAFNRGWKGWAAAARARGCEIVNATIGSSITEFPFVAPQAQAA